MKLLEPNALAACLISVSVKTAAIVGDANGPGAKFSPALAFIEAPKKIIRRQHDKNHRSVGQFQVTSFVTRLIEKCAISNNDTDLANYLGESKWEDQRMSRKRLLRFSLATLLAVTSVFAIATAVLRSGFESWQVAAAIVAVIVMCGASFGATFQKARHWGYWIGLVVVSVPLMFVLMNTVETYGHLSLLIVFGIAVAMLTRHFQLRYLSANI